jgi:glycerophosphoryl diester phosphodiesterase
MSVITFAHRGGRSGADDAPENSLAAFHRALRAGARGLETDAWLAGDGAVVLVHGDRVRTGVLPWARSRVRVTPSAELARLGIPRLDDLYADLGAGFDLSIDLKHPEVAAATLEVVDRLGDPSRTWLCSGRLGLLRSIRGASSTVRLVHSGRRRDLPEPVERHAAALADHRIDAMNLPGGDWTTGLVALFHRFERRAFAWNVTETRHLRAALTMGVDAVYCDHVTRMVAVVAEFDGRRD